MKANKSVFFIVAAVILLISYVAIFGVHIPLSDGKSLDISGSPDMRFGIDIRGGVDAVFEPTDQSIKPTAEQLEAAKVTIENRLDKLNILDRDVTSDTQNGDIIVRFPWKSGESDFDPEKAIAELGQTAKLTFVDPDGNIVLDGSHVSRSIATYDRSSTTYDPIVSLTFDDAGKKLFADATTRLVNKEIKIYMDDVEISHPTVQEPILDGSAMINHIGSAEEAQSLANKIAAGSLPFSLTSRNHSIISPTLGFGALEVMVQAGLTAFAVICIFLLLYYRLSGFVACIALLLQVTGQLLALSIPQITLTLPGIAAVILSIGMGVDANVIVSERIREELRAGRPIQSAISAGFENSFLAVFDGNITVLIVAVIMMIFGSGSLLSFAYSLLTGIILNFLAGVTASRLMLRSLTKFKALRNPKFFMKRGAEA